MIGPVDQILVTAAGFSLLHVVSKFSIICSIVSQPDLRYFACMEFGTTILLAADHIMTSQTKPVEKSFKQMWERVFQTNVDTI